MKKLFFILTVLSVFSLEVQSQYLWNQLSSFPFGGLERSFSFEIDDKIYIGTGRQPDKSNTAEVWTYDVNVDAWTQLEDFPGGAIRNTFSFSTKNFGYVGTGYDGFNHLSDFWRYDPVENTWTQLEDFPGGVRSHALGISLEDKGCVFGGGDGVNIYHKDAWVFNEENETWTQIEDLPGPPRWRMFGWVIENKIYVGGGEEFFSTPYTDFYSFDLEAEEWTRLQDCATPRTVGGFAFELDNHCMYIEGAASTTGNLGSDFYQYDITEDTWTQVGYFQPGKRIFGFSKNVGDKVILGSGYDPELSTYYDEIFSVEVDSLFSNANNDYPLDFSIYPNPVIDSKLHLTGKIFEEDEVTITITNSNGQQIQNMDIIKSGEHTQIIQVGQLLSGVYTCDLYSKRTGKRISKKFIKM